MVRSVVLAAALSFVMFSGVGCATDSAGVAKAKAEFFGSWTKASKQVYTTDKLKTVVANSPDFLSFDGMSQGKTVIEGWQAYADIWGPGINGFQTASLTEQKAVRTWISGDLAITASIAHIQATLPDGKKLDMPGHLTLGWQKIDGQWKLVHEHMSLGVKE